MSMIGVDYGVLNQKGSPSWFSDIYANIPTAGYKGRMFISIDTYAFYRDTGTGWDLIGGPGTGTLTGSGTTGQVSFFNGTQTITGNNNLFWDNTNSRLGINTTTPGVPLDIHATGTNAQFNGTGTSNAYLTFQNAGTSKWRIGNTYNAGANSFDIYNVGLTNTPLSINSATNLITLSANVTTTGIQGVQNGLNLGYANGGVAALSTILYGSTTGINFGLANGTGGANFIFQTANGYNYTFPASAGTLALTSNLSSYLPLAGGTLTGNLNGTNAIFTGEVYNATTGTYFLSNAIANTSYPTYGFTNNVGIGMYRAAADVLGFITSSTERMRITSGGIVLINQTSNTNSGRLSITENSTTNNLISLTDTGTPSSGVYYIAFFNSSNTFAGGVNHLTASTVVYYTGPSDQRLKSNIKDVKESVLPLFNDVKLKTYNHIADEDESVVYKGFLAQDMVDKFPEAYGLDKDGYYTFNPNGYIPYLVKAIQELNEKLVRNNIN